jgi:hypothetical protein
MAFSSKSNYAQSYLTTSHASGDGHLVINAADVGLFNFTSLPTRVTAYPVSGQANVGQRYGTIFKVNSVSSNTLNVTVASDETPVPADQTMSVGTVVWFVEQDLTVGAMAEYESAITSLQTFQTAVQGVWTAYTPTATGFTGTVNSNVARYMQIGKMVWVRLEVDGTSNSTTFSVTVPVPPKSSGRTSLISVFDNSTWYSTGVISLTTALSTATVLKDSAGSTFTATGGKGIDGSFSYEAA